MLRHVRFESDVSTHSRAEAAALKRFILTILAMFSFNTQPRGGGCGGSFRTIKGTIFVSTHSRAEAAAFYDQS